MKLLLDECVPRRLKNDLFEHETLNQAGFTGLKNGKLIEAAGRGKFEVLITVDKNIQHQQNKNTLPVAIVILSAFSNRYESLSPLIPKTLRVLTKINIGEIVIIK